MPGRSSIVVAVNACKDTASSYAGYSIGGWTEPHGDDRYRTTMK